MESSTSFCWQHVVISTTPSSERERYARHVWLAAIYVTPHAIFLTLACPYLR